MSPVKTSRRETIDLGKSIYWNDEVKIRIEGVSTNGLIIFIQENKYVNEFKVLDLIGRGAYSKVKRVVRQFTEQGQNFEEVYAMKVIFAKGFMVFLDDAQAYISERTCIALRRGGKT